VGTWQTLLLVYLTVLGVSIVFVATTAALLTAVGGRAQRIDLGTPPVIPLRRVEPAVRLGPVPLGVVEIAGAGEPADAPLVERDWRALGIGRRLLVIVGPWLVMAGLALALLGPSGAARSFGSAIGQLIFTLDPTPLVRRFFALAAAAPPRVTAGVLLAKIVVLNLLPFGSLAGGQIVRLLWSAGRGELSRGGQIWLVLTTAFVMLYLGGRFAYAIVRAVVG
jgi:hypothetical protein